MSGSRTKTWSLADVELWDLPALWIPKHLVTCSPRDVACAGAALTGEQSSDKVGNTRNAIMGTKNNTTVMHKGVCCIIIIIITGRKNTAQN